MYVVFVHRENTNRQSDVLGVIRSLVGFTKKHVDKAEWTEKKVDVGQIIK